MTVRDELVRAAVLAGADAATIVRVHRLAVLVEHSERLQEAIESEAVVEALVAERYHVVLKELQRVRRRAILAEAALAAREVAA